MCVIACTHFFTYFVMEQGRLCSGCSYSHCSCVSSESFSGVWNCYWASPDLCSLYWTCAVTTNFIGVIAPKLPWLASLSCLMNCLSTTSSVSEGNLTSRSSNTGIARCNFDRNRACVSWLQSVCSHKLQTVHSVPLPKASAVRLMLDVSLDAASTPTA